MITFEIFSAWLIVFLTLSIFSYLYDDNPFYKAAEHLYVGVSAGYGAVIAFWQQIQPNMFGRLWPNIESLDLNKIGFEQEKIQMIYNTEGSLHDAILNELGIFYKLWYFIYDGLNFITTGFGLLERSVYPEGGIDGYDFFAFSYLIPFLLGIFMLLRLVPQLSWLARWPIAYIVGMAAGLRFYGYLNSDILMQVQASVINFSQSPINIFNSLLVFIGTLTGLVYFFFSKEHKGSIGFLSKIGIYFLMIKFGASFGFAVMGRISLLIGRIQELKNYSTSEFYFASPILIIFIVVVLFIWSSKQTKELENV
jgi:hypothetical protein